MPYQGTVRRADVIDTWKRREKGGSRQAEDKGKEEMCGRLQRINNSRLNLKGLFSNRLRNNISSQGFKVRGRYFAMSRS